MNDSQKIGLKRCLTIREKQNIITKISELLKDRKLTTKELSTELNLPRSTISTILSNRKAIEAIPVSETERCRRRNKKKHPRSGTAKYEQLERKLQDWMTENEVLKGVLVRKKALELSTEMRLEGFSASNGWLDRFMKKYKKNVLPVCDHSTGSTNQDVEPGPNIKSEDFLEYILKENLGQTTTLTRSQQYHQLSTNLGQWEDIASAEGVKITGAILREMAIALAGALGVESFAGSNGWFDQYRKRRAKMKLLNCSQCKPVS